MQHMRYVKCTSQKARERLESLIGKKPTVYYNLVVQYYLYEVPADYINQALQIPGVLRGQKKPIEAEGIWHDWKEVREWKP